MIHYIEAISIFFLYFDFSIVIDNILMDQILYANIKTQIYIKVLFIM